MHINFGDLNKSGNDKVVKSVKIQSHTYVDI